jgi:hypothetical protein
VSGECPARVACVSGEGEVVYTEQFNHRERRERKEKQADGQMGAIIWRVKTIPFPSSLPCDLCVLCGLVQQKAAKTRKFFVSYQVAPH